MLILEQAKSRLLTSIGYLPAVEQADVRRALDQAIIWHGDQARQSGEPYVTHPIAVTTYLAGLEAGRDVLIASLLHDVIEDRPVMSEDIHKFFGERVATLVDGVTKLAKMEYPASGAQRQIASLRKLLQVATQDLRVLVIKLADRWHNVQSLQALRADKAQRIARETLEVYVPLARMVGLWDLKNDLENACFPLAYPDTSAAWSRAVADVRAGLQAERLALVDRLDHETSDVIEARLDLMTDYELFMRFQGNPDRLQQSSALDSILMIVKNPQTYTLDCYRVLGEIHERYRCVPLSFRDYISVPQSNGYRALHTVVFISKNHQVRLRIQTARMYEYAARRKLSYWLREGSDILAALQGFQASASTDNTQYATQLNETLLGQRMTVFTAAGELITLPRGATGVDFAVAQNPDNLLYLEGVMINGQRMEAAQELHDGDIVEPMLSASKIGARSIWLTRVKAPESRRALQQSLQDADRSTLVAQGRQLLETELRKYRTSPIWLKYYPLQSVYTDAFGKATMEDLYVAIGDGSVELTQAAEAVLHAITHGTRFFSYLGRWLGILPKVRVSNDQAMVMKIAVYAQDRTGFIYDLTRCFAERQVNIASFSVDALPAGRGLYTVRFEVDDFAHFSSLYDSIMGVRGVQKVVRKS